MSFNGSGTFNPYTPGNPVVTGTVISSTAFNDTINDIAAGLSNAVTRDGQSPPSSNLPMAGKKLTGLGPGLVAGDSRRFEDIVAIAQGGTGATTAATARAALGLPDTGAVSGLHNLLINGNFAINQRAYVSGAAVGAANTYTLDRWSVVTSGQNLTFSASGNGNQITAPAGGVEQVIEGLSIAGGSYVLNWTGTATATVGGTARTKGEVFTLTAGANVTVRFTGGTVSVAQLEPGTVATPFEPRPFGLELALCQRYFSLTDGQYNFDGALGGATVSVACMWFFAQEMRSTPTLSVVTEAGANASAVSALEAKGNRGAVVTWVWQNGTVVVSRNKSVIVQSVAEL